MVVISAEDSISLGAFGVASTVTIRCIDMYYYKHKVQYISNIVNACQDDNIQADLQQNEFVFYRWSTIAGARLDPDGATKETFNRAAGGKDDATPLKNFANQVGTTSDICRAFC